MDSDHFSFFFSVIIDSGPGGVTHRRSFSARVLFKINAKERDDGTGRDEDVLVGFLRI